MTAGLGHVSAQSSCLSYAVVSCQLCGDFFRPNKWPSRESLLSSPLNAERASAYLSKQGNQLDSSSLASLLKCLYETWLFSDAFLESTAMLHALGSCITVVSKDLWVLYFWGLGPAVILVIVSLKFPPLSW